MELLAEWFRLTVALCTSILLTRYFLQGGGLATPGDVDHLGGLDSRLSLHLLPQPSLKRPPRLKPFCYPFRIEISALCDGVDLCV